MKKRFWTYFALFAFSLLSANIAFAQKYNWPTNASKIISSSFGEFREGHFHAGIDISTNGRIGYKVFSVDSGYVWRVKVSPYGGGKALYIKQSDGNLMVFYHLDRFAPKIQKLIDKKQTLSGKYRQDIYLKSGRIKVKKGEIVAYTGATGSGPPHLHVELRKPEDTPINPFQNGFKSADKYSPKIRKLLFTPLDSKSSVENSSFPKVVKLKNLGKTKYSVPNITIWGKVGIGIACYDVYAKNSNKLGIFSYEVIVDNLTIIKAEYDKFSYSQTGLIDIERDYRQWKTTKTKFQKLYILPRNNLNFYKYSGNNRGILVAGNSENSSLSVGEHAYLIKVMDINGNTSSVSGKLIVNNPKLTKQNISSGSNGCFNIAKEITFKVLDSHIVVISDDNSGSHVPYFRTQDTDWQRIANYFIGDQMESVFEIPSEGNNYIEYGVMENGEIISKLKEYGKSINKNATTLINEDGSLKIDIPSNCFYSPTFLRIKKVHSLSGSNLNIQSDVFTIDPYEIPLRRKIKLTFKLPPHPIGDKLGIYKYNSKKGEWSFLETKRNKSENTYFANSSSLETFAMLADTIKPAIKTLYPKDRQVIKNRKPKIKYYVDDSLSGFASEESLELFVNGTKVISEYDPELKQVKYKIKNRLARGDHKLKLIAKDNMGNTSTRNSVFTVLDN